MINQICCSAAATGGTTQAAASIARDQAPRLQTNYDEAQQGAPAPSSSSSSGRDREQHREGGGRPWLKRAFSLVERENLNVDYESMNSLDKVKPHRSSLALPCIVAGLFFNGH